MDHAPLPSPDDCIAALATGAAPAGVAIVRLSGARAMGIARRLARLPDPMPARKALLARLHHPVSGAALDEAVTLYFQAPASFTGEDVVELQCHGGLLNVEQVLAAICAAGARLAEPGEFSRRAFVHGRLTLERAEALADLVTAETDAALQAARSQLRGEVGKVVEAIASEALELRAEVEAALDFPDEASEGPGSLAPRAAGLAGRCEELLATHGRGRALREGVRVVFAGAPNAGKSSLFNALLGEDRAIVDHEAGTTRDALEARFELDGIPVVLVDTAGLREEGAGRVELRGIERARAEIGRASVPVWVIDASCPVAPPLAEREGEGWLEVLNKVDLAASFDRAGAVRVSARTGVGVEELRAALALRIRGGEPKSAGQCEVVITHRRHAELLGEAARAFARAARNAVEQPLEIVAYDLAEGARAVERIVGSGVDDALLDTIFSRFCIGK
ncbi:MAG: tRNA uridine-5-carboxymethylaminomethyl(34) synthesis GTPase MnmE [Deltaproteobacteria bacterium]|nr:tRNA uridine-5-carboxymethylaminomethyl(34) synthesis GTPase MnmE [Deltaproteobacteria bacterium]